VKTSVAGVEARAPKARIKEAGTGKKKVATYPAS
jgi:hypothetical protein